MAEKIWGNSEISFWAVDIDELELLENNPRYMPREKFKRLVENIKRDGYLASVPFCIRKPDGKFKVLSGNHRVKAAREAGLKRIIVMTPNENLPEDKQRAIALSHNALVGEDDPFLLKRMYDSITNADDKLYSGLDEKTLEKLIEKVSAKKLFTCLRFDYKVLTLAFLPEEIEAIEKILDEVDVMLRNKEVYLGRMKDYEILKKALAKATVSFNVKSRSTALMALIEWAYDKLKEEER